MTVIRNLLTLGSSLGEEATHVQAEASREIRQAAPHPVELAPCRGMQYACLLEETGSSLASTCRDLPWIERLVIVVIHSVGGSGGSAEGGGSRKGVGLCSQAHSNDIMIPVCSYSLLVITHLNHQPLFRRGTATYHPPINVPYPDGISSVSGDQWAAVSCIRRAGQEQGEEKRRAVLLSLGSLSWISNTVATRLEGGATS